MLAAVLVAAATPFVVADLDELRDGAQKTRSEADFYGTLPVAIAKAGGARRGQALRKVYTGPFQVQAVAWHLQMHSGQIGIDPEPPGIVDRRALLRAVARRALPARHRDAQWVVRRACAA